MHRNLLTLLPYTGRSGSLRFILILLPLRYIVGLAKIINFLERQIIIQGEKIFQALLKAGTDRGVTIRIAQNAPTQNYPNVDTEFLVKRKAAQVRSLNFVKILGGGVLHTKMWIIDRQHVYIGSANMDWRSLTQVILSN